MKNIAVLILFIGMIFSVVAQQESSDVTSGNKQFKAKKFTEAEIEYRKGLQKNPKSFEANYNLGNALYKQGKFTDALEQFKTALALQPKEKDLLAASFHNAGNALLSEKKLQESIDAYKMSLKANPKDNDTRYNLAYAQALLKKQEQDKDKNKDKDKDKDKQDKEDQQQQPKPQPQQPQMNKENAQQILDALMQDEKNTLDKAKKQQVKGKRSAEKDW